MTMVSFWRNHSAIVSLVTSSTGLYILGISSLRKGVYPLMIELKNPTRSSPSCASDQYQRKSSADHSGGRSVWVMFSEVKNACNLSVVVSVSKILGKISFQSASSSSFANRSATPFLGF